MGAVDAPEHGPRETARDLLACMDLSDGGVAAAVGGAAVLALPARFVHSAARYANRARGGVAGCRPASRGRYVESGRPCDGALHDGAVCGVGAPRVSPRGRGFVMRGGGRARFGYCILDHARQRCEAGGEPFPRRGAADGCIGRSAARQGRSQAHGLTPAARSKPVYPKLCLSHCVWRASACSQRSRWCGTETVVCYHVALASG